MVGVVSAAGLVGFLSEPDPELRVFALKSLDSQIDLLWTEVVNAVPDIEALYEDESFPERELAALVASKVYYHLQEYNESMVLALGAGKLFKLDNGGEYEETIIAKCVDTFISLSAAQKPSTGDQSAHLNQSFPASGEGATSTSASLTSPITPFSKSALPSKSLLSRQEVPGIDAAHPGGDDTSVQHEEAPLVSKRGVQRQLQAVIERLFEECFRQKSYRQVIGIAIEAKNLDVLRMAIIRASEDEKKQQGEPRKSEELMEYVLDICMGIVQERAFRNEILKLILELLNEIPAPDYFSIAKCVVYLNEHSMASVILRQLVEKGDSRSLAVAYQISFDLYDNSTQEFLQKVRQEIAELVPETDADKENADAEPKESDPLLEDQSSSRQSGEHDDDSQTAFKNILAILDGIKTIQLNLEFLYRNNKADVAILNKIRDSLEARNSIFHTAVTLSNAFMHAGTTHDKFFRDNLDWLSKAVNWSKFTATAALGVIHRGNLSQGQRLLQPYLPREHIAGVGGSGSVYSQGGSLYAFGLIYANHGGMAVDLIRDHFKKATEEVVQHGGALGLGVAGMATGDEGIYEDLRNVLYTDSALNGEAVGLAMGLVMLGTGNMKALEDMIQYAHDTQHEKIVRGLAMGMALIMYGRQEAADELINGLLGDPDPTLRYGGIMTIALAYCGSGSNKAVRKLLHVAVSDVNDDVRRVAVLSLGFILFRKHQSVPRMVELLSESYNPHVRYGAAMALGISCAGTGLDEAIDLLEPMLKDSTDFVRQGALIALSMVLVQQNEAMNPRVTSLRKAMMKMIGDRHEDAMAKFGCAVALGIIDAGGRNCTISLQTQTGNLNMPGIVGAAVFVQYWYWFPLTHFLSLSFTPTSLIRSWSSTATLAPACSIIPPEQQVKAEEAPEKVKTAVLSTTAQAKRRAQRREKQARRESMDIDQTPTTPKVADQLPEKMETDEAVAKDGDEAKEGEKSTSEGQKKKAEREKVGYELDNMSRVLPAQLKYLTFPDPRYEPVKRPTGGVVVVLDKQPEEPREIVELKASKEPRQPAPPAETLQDRLQAAIGTAALQTPQRAAARAALSDTPAGAAAAAGVLTAADEDEEGAEDAPLPDDFTYETDGEDE
ncbi:26S proteasome regulatory complex non-ATPase subcomplex Rpn2/Psmd1 subunit [Penicillium malachiteum]|uniref:26S proteasome regulatory complex non-ATPase subcomplex Rpn2/Psmd1 subunit n=1 Tax=Penicillium malachiteum TaxID=1324776 RepID=UPI002546B7AC|nr:26S proteasome regulatory complex non-ATPase subcomplex Rpn2/Psmd1 subunit [Penicillium malachiteum]KAJ5731324.1 26S proteasome regulatory complex non-ATPase subcomplex Rpn2/Psmd1 subunit [Penicillium malachiteum]